MATLEEIERDLRDRLDGELPVNLESEGDLERQHVLPCVWRVTQGIAGIHVYAHPWKQKRTCDPDCSSGLGLLQGPNGFHGCWKCWNKSKSSGAVKLYGTHCFDVVMKAGNETLALEIKLLRASGRGNARKNGEFQRFVGQCLLASLVHTRVVGFCVADESALDWDATRELDALARKGVKLIVRHARIAKSASS
jgi:hypothetical protein